MTRNPEEIKKKLTAEQKELLNEEQKLSEAQKFFTAGQKILAHYKNLSEQRELTADEEGRVNKTKNALWEKISRYAMLLIKQRRTGYRLPSDAFSDLIQDCSVIFFEKLPQYDPARNTPSTFFKYQFNGVISEYLYLSQNLSAHYAQNLTRIRKAAQKLEQEGIKCTIEMLATETELKVTVIKKTLEMASGSIHANDEILEFMPADIPTPEAATVEKILNEDILNRLSSVLTNEELIFFQRKVTMERNHDRTYAEMQKLYPELSLHQIKAKHSRIIGKLKADRELIVLLGPTKQKNKTAKIKVREKNENVTDEMQNDILNIIKNSKKNIEEKSNKKE